MLIPTARSLLEGFGFFVDFTLFTVEFMLARNRLIKLARRYRLLIDVDFSVCVKARFFIDR